MDGTNGFNPIFVVGSARSGTTLIGKILSSHKDFYNYRAETLLMPICKKKYGNIFSCKEKREVFLRDWFDSRQFKRSNLNNNEFSSLVGNSVSYADLLIHFLEAMAKKHNKGFIVDSTPANAHHMSEISKVSSKAKFVWVIRDGRDVALSQTKLGWVNPPPPYKGELDKIHYSILTWKILNQRALSYKNDNSLFLLRFEDFMESPSEHLAELAEFLGLEREDFDLTSALDVRSSNSAFGRLGEGDNMTPLARWKSLEQDSVRNFSKMCSGTLLRLGYTPVKESGDFSLYIRYFYFYAHIKMKQFFSKYYVISRRTTGGLEKEEDA